MLVDDAEQCGLSADWTEAINGYWADPGPRVAIAINTTEPSIQPGAAVLFFSIIWNLNGLCNLEVPQCTTQRPYNNNIFFWK